MNFNWLLIPTLALAILLFAVGEKCLRRLPSVKQKSVLVISTFLIGLPGFLYALYYLHLFDNEVWFYQLRSLPFAEVLAAGSGLFAGVLAGLFKKPGFIPRALLLVFLCCGVLLPYLKPVIAPLDTERLADRWQDDVCMQSTLSSCGPASAATVLKSLGLPVTEKEIAQECFTYRGGTENWYLARALRRRGFRVKYRICSGFPADLHAPAIAGVRVGGFGHFIAVLAKKNGHIVTGDPLSGRMEIPAEKIQQTFRFTGFFMEIAPEDDRKSAAGKAQPPLQSSNTGKGKTSWQPFKKRGAETL